MSYLEKEFKELTRSSGLWFALGIAALLSVILLLQALSYPQEQAFTMFLLGLYEINTYVLPLLAMLMAAFAILQEREQKTLLMLLTRQESFRSFFAKKSVAVHTTLLLPFLGWYLLFALVTKLFLRFEPIAFLHFLVTVAMILVIFTQLGLMLGSMCRTRMQVVSGAIFIWFFLLFLADLVFLYLLPTITNERITLFSALYFLHPLHAAYMYLQTSLELVSIAHMSRIMQKFVWLHPAQFLAVNLLFWTALLYGVGVIWGRKGERG